jgi:hypothetical protein
MRHNPRGYGFGYGGYAKVTVICNRETKRWSGL